MNLYSQFVLPRLLDWSMSDASLSRYRQKVLAQVTGETLEIGFGTGLNLPYYPKHIQKLTTVDANPGMNALALKRIEASDLTVENHVLNGENLPFADQSFDSVVSTWTLCSIANVQQALQEIYRVLKPGGRFFFIEHGLSDNPKVQVWQNRLTPVQKVIADGCHFNRDIKRLVENQFNQVTVEQFQAENLPAIMGYFYKGVAVKT
ncbi:class I SAM-dependent methyltransferase [Mastigocladopsis repens]|uniref:class I SAM-dependent methyltransferase n=1 Tax=Mastigocladopsis repens TaxID=221287 RepID=UPI0002F41C3E|nr:class I SAM-dependent methyltransferase [Mastigocladopsis repens]